MTTFAAGRYTGAAAPHAAAGWTLTRVTEPSRLFGANGLRAGPDGRLYVAQVTGSQISAVDVDTGMLDTISPKGGDIIAPDDVAFGPDGTLYATEVMDGRVSARDVAGRTLVLRDDLPSANGVTVHRGRLFVNECRDGGRLVEMDLGGGPPRLILENLPSPNAMEVGPDGLLYFPVMGANEIWRVDPDAIGPAEPQVVAGELGVPDSVKFDADGYLVSTQVAGGQVLRIDPRSGSRTVLADLGPGLDNCAFVDGRLFVSSFTGRITEVLPDGRTQALLPDGLNWPLDITTDPAGNLYVADGTYFYRIGAEGSLDPVGMLFTPGYPGFLRGLAPAGPGAFVVTTSGGHVARYHPSSGETDYLATGLDQLYGVALAPNGIPMVAEQGTGRLLGIGAGGPQTLAADLDTPVGVAIDPDGHPLVSVAGAVVRVTPAGTETVVADLVTPQGILVRDSALYIVDAGAKTVLSVDLVTGARHPMAGGLPVGAPPGVTPKPLRGMPPFSGPQGPFAGITAGPDGTLYVSADGEGSVLALRRA